MWCKLQEGLTNVHETTMSLFKTLKVPSNITSREKPNKSGEWGFKVSNVVLTSIPSLKSVLLV